MVKVNLKNKFRFLNQSKVSLSNNSDLGLEEKINTSATWFQSMEPIKYAINNEKKLRKFKHVKINNKDTKVFKKLLFNSLKKQLDECKKQIKEEFLRTSDGSLNVGLNVILIDSMLREILINTYPHFFGSTNYKLSIIAVGGYGRGELAPHSDLDLLFLTSDNLNKVETENLESLIQFILYLLWDLAYTVGHSTRTIIDCIEKSKSDLTISTSLLEKRFIAGNEQNFDLLKSKFNSFIGKRKILNFVEAKLEESDLRHKKFGGSRYVVEPNVKDGKGGLRDLHTLIWISKYAYKVDSISKLIKMGALSKNEALAFAEAQRFLLSVRCHLHYRAEREDDRLAMDAQLEIAKSMNFKNTITHKDVERFMKRYFLATKTVGNLTRIFCAAIETEFKKPLRLNFLSFKKSEKVDPFSIELNRLYVLNRKVLTENPVNIIKLFFISHKKNIDIHPRTLRLITSLTKLINSEVRHDFKANQMFLDILTSNTDSTRTLRIMNESNILGKFIPEFQKIVCLMQFDMYHSYTVDEHTIFTISNLHSLKNGKFKSFAPLASKVILEIDSYRCLFVAMLLHDIAKGKKGDHSVNGSIIASIVCPRLGLSNDETEIVKWLVLHHLLLSKTAFRYELGDPKIIKDFVNKVKSVERLKLLLVLTVADIKGVGPEIWNDWKGSLISDLYLKSLDILERKHFSKTKIENVKTTKKLFKINLSKNGINNEVIDKYSNNFYKNYWEIFNLQTVINHFYIFKKMFDEERKYQIYLSDESDLQASELIVIAPDHHGLFSLISGLVAASGYDVVSAKIITRSDGYALDTFFIQNKEKKPISDDFSRKKLIKTIILGLEGNFNLEKALNIKWEEIPARFRAVKAPTRIIVDNKTSENFTILDVKCKNAPGVLYKITKTLTSLGLQINTATVSTYGDRVVDIFYLKNAFGLKVYDEKTIVKIKKSILSKLEEINLSEQKLNS